MFFFVSLRGFSALVLLIGLLATLFVSSPLRADVRVQTVDGRELSGVVDSKTDENLLWIRHEESRIVLTTSVPWSAVETATVDGTEVEVAELADRSAELATDPPKAFLAWCEEDIDTGEFIPPGPAALPIGYLPIHRRRVASVQAAALLVNNDRDVQPDGLQVWIAAVDRHGVPMPVDGSIYARLWGERLGVNASHIRFDDFQHWSHPVHPVDFRDGVASYYLQFRNVRPEFNWELPSVAMLNVRLGARGEGNFEASVPVEIRLLNPIRDRLQFFTRSRFFRDELTEPSRYLPGP